MEVQVQRGEGRGAKIVIQGDIRIDVAPRLREDLRSELGSGTTELVVDLSGVEYIDSSGLATLLECLKDLKRVGGEMVLVGVRSSLLEVFKVARLEEVFGFEEKVNGKGS